MLSRNGNYAAFYVNEPFNSSTLGAHGTRDFQFYNLLRAWKGADLSFPFYDSHSTTYNVRDGSNWELTLRPRLRERIRNSKNIILFLSSITANSRALREEIEYGINDQGIPVIIVYPGYDTKESLLVNGGLAPSIKALWNALPIFRDSVIKVPTLHIPLNKEIIRVALSDTDLMIGSKTNAGIYHYTP